MKNIEIKKNNVIKEKDIQIEADYCLNCKVKPCSIKGCPLNNNIPEFIKEIKNYNYHEAYKVLSKTTIMPAICGRICPHYKQCMGSCVRGAKGEPVNIGKLEAIVGDWYINQKNINFKLQKNKKKIAIVGGGPAGITCAAFLARKGCDVTIYEKKDYLGGLLVHGIPEFRLPRDIIKKTIDKVLRLDIKVEYNKELGKNLNLKDLEKKYNNIVLAFGANKSIKMRIIGEDLNGVYGANELLEFNMHPNYSGKIVAINGGGNVAMDVARTIKRLGAKKVIVIYRRSKDEMPAEKKEIEDAIAEGVEFLFQNNIVKIIGDKQKVKKIELIKTNIKKNNEDYRTLPVNIEGSNYEIYVDFVIMAIGSNPEKITQNLGLEVDLKGYIKVDENGKTSNSKIYAIGDIAGNSKTVAWASRSGRDVAEILS